MPPLRIGLAYSLAAYTIVQSDLQAVALCCVAVMRGRSGANLVGVIRSGARFPGEQRAIPGRQWSTLMTAMWSYSCLTFYLSYFMSEGRGGKLARNA